MRYSIQFSGVEGLLARTYDVAFDKRMAFQARLKNYLRIGLLDEVKAGRGKAANFESHHVLLLALAMEFAQMGVSPEKTVAIIRANLAKIAAAVIVSVPASKDGFGPDWSPTILFFDPKAVSNLMHPDWPIAEVEFCSLDQFKEAFRALIAQNARMAIISITALIVRLVNGLNTNPDYPMGPFFASGIREWALNYDLHPQT